MLIKTIEKTMVFLMRLYCIEFYLENYIKVAIYRGNVIILSSLTPIFPSISL